MEGAISIVLEKIESLQQFYELMFETRDVRQKIVDRTLHRGQINPSLIQSLKDALSRLEQIPLSDGRKCLSLNKNKPIQLDMDYEINELNKDIFFLEHNEDEFHDYLNHLHQDFLRQIQDGESFFEKIYFKNLITDRDGTVNNYCGRYKSSIQSAYNAIFLSRFTLNNHVNTIILTSAPLINIGMADMSVAPTNIFIYAGSKGREYLDKNGARHQHPIEKEKQKILNSLNKKLINLIKQAPYEIFSLIGSGLQLKFGQTTIAHQDIYNTIPLEESVAFRKKIEGIVQDIDPNNEFFRIEDTGKDLEIILTIKDKTQVLKDFDKGDAVRFLNKDLRLGMEKSFNLICGDTKSDIPMVSASMEFSQDTWTIFVTKDEELKKQIKEACPNTFFVSEPDVLVALLNKLGKDENL